MLLTTELPCPDNRYHQAHAELLAASYRRLLGRELSLQADATDLGEMLYHADFALLSHNIAADPLFNYANRRALELFEFSWSDLIGLPSRFSAEPVNRQQREQLLAQVSRYGYIDHYSGVRIAQSGRRFMIRGAVVWNLVDQFGNYQGQAACFGDWEFLS